MIVVTGGAGFIGSAFVWRLNQEGFDDILVVDHLGTGPKWKNLGKRRIVNCLHKDDLTQWLQKYAKSSAIEAIFHLGACSSTTERDADYLMRNNVHYSMDLFEFAAREGIPFIYASSAATYGAGEAGYTDEMSGIARLRPINPYGYSKHLFDCWALRQKTKPPVWVGLKYFNVFGPQEYHKGSQASVVYHAFPQIRDHGQLKLFKSYRPDYRDGEQKRDFVYVKDVVDVMYHIFRQRTKVTSGIYNLGSGLARTWKDLGAAVFGALEKGQAKFEFIEMPDNLRGQYQYFTEAPLTNLRSALSYDREFMTLENAINDYVQNHLLQSDQYL